MYQVKLFNKISKVGLDDLDPAKYTCSEDYEDYEDEDGGEEAEA